MKEKEPQSQEEYDDLSDKAGENLDYVLALDLTIWKFQMGLDKGIKTYMDFGLKIPGTYSCVFCEVEREIRIACFDHPPSGCEYTCPIEKICVGRASIPLLTLVRRLKHRYCRDKCKAYQKKFRALRTKRERQEKKERR